MQLQDFKQTSLRNFLKIPFKNFFGVLEKCLEVMAESFFIDHLTKIMQ